MTATTRRAKAKAPATEAPTPEATTALDAATAITAALAPAEEDHGTFVVEIPAATAAEAPPAASEPETLTISGLRPPLDSLNGTHALAAAPAAPQPPALGPHPQAFLGLPREAYDAMPGWNGSLLKIAYRRTCAHAWAAYRDPLAPQREDTAAFRIGSLTHAAILEPERFATEYVVLPPDAPRRPTDKQLVEGRDSKPGTKAKEAWLDAQARQDWWNEFDAKHPGAEVITAADAELVAQLSGKVLNHPGLQPFFAPGQPHGSRLNELTLTWLDPVTGHRCKARIDALRYLGQSLRAFELKSAQDGGPEPFGTAVVRYDYLLAAAFYHDAIDHCRAAIAEALGGDRRLFDDLPIGFEYVVCEKEYPFLPARYEVDDDQLSIGRRQYREALDKVTTADELGYWAGYDQAAVPLVLPAWFERMAAE